jgi:HSP20 family molecular chaperone IbpA
MKKIGKIALALLASGAFLSANTQSLPSQGGTDDPFAQMDRIFQMQMKQMQMMRKQMDQLFSNFEQNFKISTFKTMPIMVNSSGIFASGFQDKKDHYELKIKVNNLKDSKIDITTKDGMLTVKVSENRKVEKTNGTYGKIISYTNSSSIQSFTLPGDALPQKIEAKQKGNEITIIVPKKSKEKVITIKKEDNSSTEKNSSKK